VLQINDFNHRQSKSTTNNLYESEMYDSYAAAIYGSILRIVHKVPIGEKIPEQVFVNSFNNKTAYNDTLPTPFTLLNHSRKKVTKQLKP